MEVIVFNADYNPASDVSGDGSGSGYGSGDGDGDGIIGMGDE